MGGELSLGLPEREIKKKIKKNLAVATASDA